MDEEERMLYGHSKPAVKEPQNTSTTSTSPMISEVQRDTFCIMVKENGKLEVFKHFSITNKISNRFIT
jgi:hypothetical protein